MPVQFTCPHCQTETLVPERYAGSSGPCRVCGQQVTIPGVPEQRSRGSSSSSVLVIVLVGFLGMAVVCGGILMALLLPAVQAAREAARRAQCSNNLRQIGLAMMSYESANGSLPPAQCVDSAGQPTVSWRVALLPYMDHAHLFQAINTQLPWDSELNRVTTSKPLAIYRCPSDSKDSPGSTHTSYVAITGPKTVFDGNKTCRTVDITDGASNTILAVEVEGSDISWAEPRDMTEEEFLDQFATGAITGPHPGGINVVMCDGSVRFLPSSTPPETVRLLVEKADGQPVPPF
jgi:prepilin-type processing-associated H-X9-DG protein